MRKQIKNQFESSLVDPFEPLNMYSKHSGKCSWIVQAVMAGVSLLSSLSSSKKAGKMSKVQKLTAYQQLKQAREQWDIYKSVYAPVEEALGKEVQEGPNYARASADTAAAFDKSRAITERQMGRYGIDPTSGRFAGMEQDYGVQRARGQVDAMNREEDKQFARRLAFTQTGRGLPASSQSGLSSASSTFGNIANMYSKQATSSGGAAGYWAGKAVDSYRGGNANYYPDSGGYGLDTSFSDTSAAMQDLGG